MWEAQRGLRQCFTLCDLHADLGISVPVGLGSVQTMMMDRDETPHSPVQHTHTNTFGKCLTMRPKARQPVTSNVMGLPELVLMKLNDSN
jgi:hypothetical protein